MEKESYWSQALEKLREMGDSEIRDWRASGQDLLYSPHGILRHQRTAASLLEIQKTTYEERLDELLNRGAESLSHTLADKISGNTIAYTMYKSSSPASQKAVRAWAAATEEPLDEDKTPTHLQLVLHPNYCKGEFSQISAPAFNIEDVPTRELQRRLQRGEIIPRNEWIPSGDLNNRKIISASDARSRIQFGEKLRDEATEFMNRYKELQRSMTMNRSAPIVIDGGGCRPAARDRAWTSPTGASRRDDFPKLATPSTPSNRFLATNKVIDGGESPPMSMDRNSYQAECANVVSRANVLYTQGCNLLKYYICTEDTALGMEMEDLLRTFRHNAAVTHLKLREFRSCIKICDEGIYFDCHDGKLCWLRAKAFEELGDLSHAMNLYHDLCEDAFASDSHREAAREAWRKAAALQRASDLKEGKLVKNWYLEESQLATSAPADNRGRIASSINVSEDDCPTTPPGSPLSRSASLVGGKSRSKLTTAGSKSSSSVKSQTKRLDITPCMAPERFIQLLQDITRLYTSPPNLARFESIRAESDYDEKQIILKLRKFLPSLLQPLFVKYEFPGSSYEEMKRSYDRLEYEVQVSSQVSDRLRGLVRYHLDNLREITLSN